jgi:hypothetical protein
MMTNAAQILANDALIEKLTASITERLSLVEAETGFRPVFWKAQVQMEDDSVLEMRFELCPDGCGQINVSSDILPG